ncbi:MAG: 3-phosphoshikimate 1-carboxyvinyltransferase [Chitinophagaceae bacterium]|nr:3-phosphoshikimate 1-carboxyvinyltransferase [Chitinophagaceae bacterium]
MKVTIHPSQLKGNVQVPPSKSYTQRALAAALLRKGETIIYNAGKSNDDLAALHIIRQLGAKISEQDDGIKIVSNGDVRIEGDAEINFGESGLGARMFTPIISLSGQKVVLNGEGSLLKRPMSFFEEVLPEFGIRVKTENGKLPITIRGKFNAKKAVVDSRLVKSGPGAKMIIDGSLSSQFLTGLLFALSKSPEPVVISVKNLVSANYIDITIKVLEQFGLASVSNTFRYERLVIQSKQPVPGVLEYTVENDWSSAAFLLVAGAIAGPITIRGLDLNSVQADKAIIDVLISVNAGIAIEAKGIKIHPSPMKAFDFDATNCPDLFPPLVVLAAYCDGRSHIKGVNRLAHKESNRAIALQKEFGKMGVKIELNDDIMIIHGGKGVKGATVHSSYDHRIAMACAVAALKAEGTTTIEEAGAIKKSYPGFYNDLKSLGADVS